MTTTEADPRQVAYAAAVRKYHRARDAAAAAVEATREAAVAAMDAGLVSERAVSADLDVDRNTVRTWRGKPRVR